LGELVALPLFEARADIASLPYSNPHGGYLLAVLVDALSKHQAESKPHHPDPAHLMTQFLQGTKAGKAEIHVKVCRHPIRSLSALLTLSESPFAGHPNRSILDEPQG
jgi:hypothetical protein